jgi:23S rRNA (uridine2552-2'-O)-methyltransferase
MRRSRPDHYTDKAKKAGYEARSVYKLQAIQDRFSVIRAGDRVLDIGAAPGSWTQFAIQAVGENGSVVAVDLAPLAISAPAGVLTYIEGDLHQDAVQDAVAAAGPFDVILSDAAPATTGNRTVDTTRSAAIVELVVHLAGSWLKEGGNLVAKIFQGGDEVAILQGLRSSFESARAFKPKASRKESFETYLIGLAKLPTVTTT